MNKIKKFIHFFAPFCCEKDRSFAPLRFFATILFCVYIWANIKFLFYAIPEINHTVLLGGLAVFLPLLLWVYSNNKNKRKQAGRPVWSTLEQTSEGTHEDLKMYPLGHEI